MAGAIGDGKGVDLNAASADQLDRVGGLGQRAGAANHGKTRPFRSCDDLCKVEGFNETFVDDLKSACAKLGGRR